MNHCQTYLNHLPILFKHNFKWYVHNQTTAFLCPIILNQKQLSTSLSRKNNILWDVVKCLMDSIFSNIPISDWPHKEYKLFATLEKKTLVKFQVSKVSNHYLPILKN